MPKRLSVVTVTATNPTTFTPPALTPPAPNVRLKPAKLILAVLLTGVLSACQSNHMAHTSDAPLSPTVMASQTSLLNRADNPSPSQQAQNRLAQAIGTHLANPHTAATQRIYQVTPYTANHDIETNANVIHRTAVPFLLDMLDGWFGKDSSMGDYQLPSPYDEESQYDDAYAVVEAVAADEAYKIAQGEYDDSAYPQDEYQADDHVYDDAYEAATEVATEDANSKADSFKTMFEAYLDSASLTPEQVDAWQYYIYQHTQDGGLSHYDPKQRRFQSLYDYRITTPTMTFSGQLPWLIDFNQATVQADPTAVMPLWALMSPNTAPLPSELTNQRVAHPFPEFITDNIPSDVLFDALITATQQAVAQMPSESFTAVDIKGDDFAKQVGASAAVKWQLDGRLTGELLGKWLKNFTQQINAHVHSHPEQYANSDFANKLDKWSKAQDNYHSKDVGRLLQLIEVLLAADFGHTTYFYLDGSNRLIANQFKQHFASGLENYGVEVVSQTQYNHAAYQNSPLYLALYPAFASFVSTEEPLPQAYELKPVIQENKRKNHHQMLAEMARSELLMTEETLYQDHEYPDDCTCGTDDTINPNVSIDSVDDASSTDAQAWQEAFEQYRLSSGQ